MFLIQIADRKQRLLALQPHNWKNSKRWVLRSRKERMAVGNTSPKTLKRLSTIVSPVHSRSLFHTARYDGRQKTFREQNRQCCRDRKRNDSTNTLENNSSTRKPLYINVSISST